MEPRPQRAAGERESNLLTFAEANEIIDAESNRHRKSQKATIDIGVVHPFRRYIWLHRISDTCITVTLFKNQIAEITPDGIYATTCGYFTPSTRAAFEALFGRCVGMETPGSRGGADGEWKGYIATGGHRYEITGTNGVFVPASAVLDAR